MTFFTPLSLITFINVICFISFEIKNFILIKINLNNILNTKIIYQWEKSLLFGRGMFTHVFFTAESTATLHKWNHISRGLLGSQFWTLNKNPTLERGQQSQQLCMTIFKDGPSNYMKKNSDFRLKSVCSKIGSVLWVILSKFLTKIWQFLISHVHFNYLVDLYRKIGRLTWEWQFLHKS